VLRFLVVVAVVAAGMLGCLVCANDVFGVHDGDYIQTTIVAPYTGDASIEDFAGGDCGLDGLVPGTVLTMKATVGDLPADGCGRPLGLTILSSNIPSLAPTPGGQATLDASNGCTGPFYVRFVPLVANASVYKNDADGGPVSWVFVRDFYPLRNGTCPFRPSFGYCSDAYVARNQQIHP